MSDRCHVCGDSIYRLWIDPEPHNNECVEGKTVVTECQRAMTQARLRAQIIKDIEEMKAEAER